MNKNKIWRKWILDNRVPYVRTTYFILKFNIFHWNCPATKQKWRRIVQAVVEILKFVNVLERNFTIIIIYVCQWQIVTSSIQRYVATKNKERTKEKTCSEPDFLLRWINLHTNSIESTYTCINVRTMKVIRSQFWFLRNFDFHIETKWNCERNVSLYSEWKFKVNIKGGLAIVFIGKFVHSGV